MQQEPYPPARLLLVDDNPSNLVALRAILEHPDYDFVDAHSGEKALEDLKAEEFAVVLLDVRMPGLAGFDTARQIRSEQRTRHTPIIFLTADEIDEALVEKGYLLGAVDFLSSPLSPVVLKAKVRGFVDLYQEKRRATDEAHQLRLLVQGTSDYAIFMLDPQGQVVTWNLGAERIKGYKASEIIGQHFSKFYPEESIKRDWPAYELKVATKEGRFEDEGWRVRKDGSQFWANVVLTALRDQDGKLLGFSKVTRDLTERKQAEESIRRSEERLRHMVESVKDYAIFMLDPTGHVASWNSGAERIKLYRADEIIGQHFSKFYPQEALNRGWPEHELKVAVAEGRFEDEGWRVRKDGTQFWANVVITALKDDQGELIGFTKITRDLTVRKLAEENELRLIEETTARRVAESNARLIQDEREKLHVTLASIGDAVISTDAEGRVEYLNPVAEKLVGWTTSDAAGLNLSDVFRIVNEDTRVPVENPAYRAMREGRIVGLANHTILISKDGSETPIDDSAAPIRDTAGKVIGSVLVFRDMGDLKKNQKALAQSEGRFRGLMEQAPFSIQVLSTDGRTVQVNRAWEELWGLKLEQVAEYNVLEDPQLEAKGVAPYLRQAFAGKPTAIPAIQYDPNETLPGQSQLRESVRWVTALAYPLKGGAGEVQEIVLVHEDITERKLAEVAIEESEQRFRQLADAMPQIVWTATSDGRIDYQNRQWFEFTGLPTDLGNEGWGKILHPEDAINARERWSQSLGNGVPFEMEVRLYDHRREAYCWHLIRTVAAYDEVGKVSRWYGTGTNINEQKRSAEASRYLAEASAALAGLVDYESTLQKVANLAVPFFADWSAVDIVGEQGSLRRLAVAHQEPEKIALANQLIQEYPPDPHSGIGAFAVIRSGKPEIISEITEEMLELGSKDERHLSFIRSLGLRSYICVPLIVSHKIIGVLTFVTAESGRKYTEADLATASDLAQRAGVALENFGLYQELRDSDRRKDEFLATLAHELRNPLAPIRNALQILKMPRVDPETIERSREMMERQVHHLVRLVDDLLDVSRVMRGKIELRKERVEVASVFARAVETVQPLVDSRGHQLSVQLPTDSLIIDVDPVRLGQVVGNLLTNAAKYMEPNGHIWLTAEQVDGVAVLRVRDNGIGIAKEMLPRIFELFVQVDHASTKAQGGLGIGLTLVKNLVEMHNGTVEAYSEGLGRGSEFVIRLPIPTQQLEVDQPKADSSGDRIHPSGYRLLVVDDNQDAAMTLAMLLKLQGHEVQVAHSGPAAIEMTQTFSPDLVFLDIGMPGMDGYEVARRLRQQPSTEKVVLTALTGWGQKEDRRRTTEAGFDHHLVKPPDPKALENILASLPNRSNRIKPQHR
jgi:PAS domain S-box-containing protein